MKKTAVQVAIVLVVLLFAVFVWPTPYRYHSFGPTVAREHRITGKLEILRVEDKSQQIGWYESSYLGD